MDSSRRPPSSPDRRPPCGTERGYAAHIRWDQGAEPCEPCKLAKRRYEQARSIRAGRTSAVMVPIDVLAHLYLTATLPAVLTADSALGPEVTEAIVYRFDEHQLGA